MESYKKFKDKNINIQFSKENSHKKQLLSIRNLSFGYEKTLFSDIGFDIFYGDRLEIIGRNRVGKSTLVKTLISKIKNTDLQIKIYHGEILIKVFVNLGIYEQKIDMRTKDLSPVDAIRNIYFDLDISFNTKLRNKILSQYLFNPLRDWKIAVKDLSRGQKAILQLIKMFASNPHLIILDEPTNHLDLPYIEELEESLNRFHGGIIYISQDSYFTNNIGGKVIEVAKNQI